MYLEKLKVRPRKTPPFSPCMVELTTMLGCWTAQGDLLNRSACSETAQALFDCMRTTPMRGKVHRPSINYHLARLKKQLK